MKHNETLVCLQSKRLIEQVYTILDSRIQYIEYQAQKNCHIQDLNLASPLEQANEKTGSEVLIQNFDKMLNYLQELNKSLKLLQILKSWLKDDNVQVIFNLLNNKGYMNYTEEALENYLKTR
jgi:hypothetical protein